MKKLLLTSLLALSGGLSQAAIVTITNVDVSAVECSFNTNCTNIVRIEVDPLTLRRTTGTGFLETRVLTGERGSAAAGLYGYFYQIDLSGVSLVATNPNCVTNITRCLTNFVPVVSNLVTCRTSLVGATTIRFCSTNTLPPTNVICCVTNAVAETNFVRCFTNQAGAVFCFTNTIAATNLVSCFTNRVPARRLVVCQTNVLGGTSVVRCSTNQGLSFSNTVSCFTSTVPCEATAACIESLTIPFGPVVESAIAVTGGSGTIAAALVEQNGRFVTIRFSPPVCPGDTSVMVGLLSRERPRDQEAELNLIGGAELEADSLGPRLRDSDDIECDFDDLEDLIDDLSLSQILGSNEESRRSLRNALAHLVKDANQAAKHGNLDALFQALGAISLAADGQGEDWVTPETARRISREVADLLRCLERFLNGQDGNDDDDDDDDDDDHDRKDRDRDDDDDDRDHDDD